MKRRGFDWDGRGICLNPYTLYMVHPTGVQSSAQPDSVGQMPTKSPVPGRRRVGFNPANPQDYEGPLTEFFIGFHPNGKWGCGVRHGGKMLQWLFEPNCLFDTPEEALEDGLYWSDQIGYPLAQARAILQAGLLAATILEGLPQAPVESDGTGHPALKRLTPN